MGFKQLFRYDYSYSEKDSVWGADDDTDIEYIYQELLCSPNLDLTGEQIRGHGWTTFTKRKKIIYGFLTKEHLNLCRKGSYLQRRATLS